MPELGPYGSVRGARGNSRPYRDRVWYTLETSSLWRQVELASSFRRGPLFCANAVIGTREPSIIIPGYASLGLIKADRKFSTDEQGQRRAWGCGAVGICKKGSGY